MEYYIIFIIYVILYFQSSRGNTYSWFNHSRKESGSTFKVLYQIFPTYQASLPERDCNSLADQCIFMHSYSFFFFFGFFFSFGCCWKLHISSLNHVSHLSLALQVWFTCSKALARRQRFKRGDLSRHIKRHRIKTNIQRSRSQQQSCHIMLLKCQGRGNTGWVMKLPGSSEYHVKPGRCVTVTPGDAL